MSLSTINCNTAPYIDRRVAEGLFRELLEEKQTYRVFNVYGDSGSGKSTFVDEIYNKYLLNSKSIIAIKIDFNDRLLHKPQTTIMHIAKELERKYGFNFMALWKAYAILWHKRYEHSPLLYASDLPYFHEIKNLIKPKKNRNILDIAKGIFGDKVTKELESIKKQDTKDIEERLYRFFVADLHRIIKESKYKDCVFILENIDILGESNSETPCSKDEWVRELITYVGKYALFLITSTKELNWKSCNPNWKSVIKSYEMKPFIKKDAIRYLRLNGIKDKNFQDAIAQSSKGEPFWLSLGAVAYKNSNGKIPISKSDILEQFIETLEKDLVKLLNILSYSRFFTQDLIEIASTKFNLSINSYLIQKLLSMPFVKQLDSERYILDKKLANELKKRHSKDEVIEYQSFMFSYYENILQSIDSQIVEATPQLIDEAIEEAWYHLNLINSEPLVHFEWLDYYIDRFFMYAAWEPFLERYNKIVPKLKEAKDKTSKEKLISLYNNLAGLYESLGDTNISKKYYNMVIKLNRPNLLSA